MVRKPGVVDWMHAKYGDDTNFYQVEVKMANDQGGVDGKWSDDAENNAYRY
jgi:hypothetical protein